MTLDIDLQKAQVSALDDTDLITLYGCCAKVLHERGLLAVTRKELKRIIHSQKHQEYLTPVIYDRGKVKRTPHFSILIDFLSEDWSHLFPGDYDDELKYYVYYHTDPSMPNTRLRKGDDCVDFCGRPFYIGKGVGERYKSKKRSRSHLSIINSIKNKGIQESRIYHIFKYGLSEGDALELEAKLITFFGCSSELDRNRAHFHGMKGGILINSDPAKRPACVERMIRVKGSI